MIDFKQKRYLRYDPAGMPMPRKYKFMNTEIFPESDGWTFQDYCDSDSRHQPEKNNQCAMYVFQFIRIVAKVAGRTDKSGLEMIMRGEYISAMKILKFKEQRQEWLNSISV